MPWCLVLFVLPAMIPCLRRAGSFLCRSGRFRCSIFVISFCWRVPRTAFSCWNPLERYGLCWCSAERLALWCGIKRLADCFACCAGWCFPSFAPCFLRLFGSFQNSCIPCRKLQRSPGKCEKNCKEMSKIYLPNTAPVVYNIFIV